MSRHQNQSLRDFIVINKVDKLKPLTLEENMEALEDIARKNKNKNKGE